MRESVCSQFGWPLPEPGPDPGPDWRIWRDVLVQAEKRDGEYAQPQTPSTPGVPRELCRTFRGFVAFKEQSPS